MAGAGTRLNRSGMMIGAEKGLGMITIAVTALIAAAVSGAVGDASMLSSLGLLATMGAGMFGVGAIRLPGWARLRQRQMEEVAGRVAAIASAQPARDRLKPGPQAG